MTRGITTLASTALVAAGILGGCVTHSAEPPEPVPVAEWCARSDGFLRNPYFDPDQKAALAQAMRDHGCLEAPPRVKTRAFLHP